MFNPLGAGNLKKWIICLMLSGGLASTSNAMDLQVTYSSSSDATVSLSLEELDKLEQVQFTTKTIWTDGADTYSGVSLTTLLAHLEAKGKTVEMTALNDYAASMPMSDLKPNAPIVATRMNGDPMSVRDKGPYWVVYPYDDDPSYRTETAYTRSIWQLNRLKVID